MRSRRTCLPHQPVPRRKPGSSTTAELAPGIEGMRRCLSKDGEAALASHQYRPFLSREGIEQAALPPGQGWGLPGGNPHLLDGVGGG